MQSSSSYILAPVSRVMSFLLIVALLIDSNSTLKIALGWSSIVQSFSAVSEKSTLPQVCPLYDVIPALSNYIIRASI